MNIEIKTSAEIFNMMKNLGSSSKANGRWVSLPSLREKIQEKYDESDNLAGDLKDIRDLGRMDSLRWVLSLLEENK
jgi:hypothetical protein